MFSRKEQEYRFVESIVLDIQEAMGTYFDERKINLNNFQLLSFMMASPMCIAIALDKELDNKEEEVVDYFSGTIHEIFVSRLGRDLTTLIRMVETDKVDSLSDEEYVLLLQREARYLVSDFDRWTSAFTGGIKSLLRLDEIFVAYNPDTKTLRRSIIESMYLIVKANLGEDEVEEKRLAPLLHDIGIEVTDEEIERIVQSISN